MDAIVFLVDAVDKERFSESKKELDGLLSVRRRHLVRGQGCRRTLCKGGSLSDRPGLRLGTLGLHRLCWLFGCTADCHGSDLDITLSQDDSLASVPFLVLGNKIDIPSAASEARLSLACGTSVATATSLRTRQLPELVVRCMVGQN